MNPFRWIASWLTHSFSLHRNPPQDFSLRVLNLTRQTVLATSMEVANTDSKRRKGLLGRDDLSAGGGMWICPCEAVHTFWMRFPIDLVYLDRKYQIRKIKSEVRPWRLSGCLSAHSVIELPSGTIHKTQTQPGDILEFTAASLGD